MSDLNSEIINWIKIAKGGPGSGRHKEYFSSKFESMNNYNQPSSKMTAKEMAAKRDESIANAKKLEKEFHTFAIHGDKDSKTNEKLAHLARMISGYYRVAASLDPINHTAYEKQARSWGGRAFDLQETVSHTYSASEMLHQGIARYVSKGGPGSGRRSGGYTVNDIYMSATNQPNAISYGDAGEVENAANEHEQLAAECRVKASQLENGADTQQVASSYLQAASAHDEAAIDAHRAASLLSNEGGADTDRISHVTDNAINNAVASSEKAAEYTERAVARHSLIRPEETPEYWEDDPSIAEQLAKSAVRKGGPGSGRHPKGWAGKYSGGAMSNYHDTRSNGQEDTSPAGRAHTDASNDHLNNYGYTRTSDGRSKAEITDQAEALSEAQGDGIDEPTRLALLSDAMDTNLGDGHQWNDFEESILATASDHEELANELREQGFTASADAHLAAAQAFNDLVSKGNFGNYTNEQLEEMADQANELAYTADNVTQDEIYRATLAPSRPADYKQSSVGAWLDRQEMLGKSSVRKGGPGSGRHPETGMPNNCGHRDFDPQTTVAQIGKMNILGLSGGRVSVLTEKNKPVGIELPIGHGYKVRVYLADNDTYTVQRVNVRAGKVNVKGEQTDVYADEVGEVAYNAGMYVNVSFGEDKR
jgi:hypothetical protein